MEAHELFIGAWVMRGDIVEEPMKVTEIIPYKDYVCMDFTGLPVAAKFSQINPIPLTSKILEKNGFIYKKLKGMGDKEIWRIEDEHYDIDIYEWSDSIWIFRYDYVEMSSPHTQVTMGYVHELQLALKLCGIKKEIVL